VFILLWELRNDRTFEGVDLSQDRSANPIMADPKAAEAVAMQQGGMFAGVDLEAGQIPQQEEFVPYVDRVFRLYKKFLV